jgi:hypothetical protein
VSVNAAITTLPSGQPANVNGWTIAYVSAPDLASVLARSDVDPLPAGLTLDSVLSNQQARQLVTMGQTYYGATVTISAGDTLRDGLNRIIRTLDPTFSVDQLYLPPT